MRVKLVLLHNLWE